MASIALIGVVLLIGPVINKPLTLDDVSESANTATARWIARDFVVDYRISLNENGTLRAEVEETTRTCRHTLRPGSR